MSGTDAAGEQRMLAYDVFEHLGSGATSDVYRVVSKSNHRTYVLKKMSLANMSDEEQLRAKQEIIVMDNVEHPNVVKFRESFSDPVDNSVDIVMEYCEFGTLEDLIERQRYEGHPFPTDVLLEWMAEVLCGLAHIHSNRILHRDLKTSNIFVTSKNHLKLGDFGVCTILSNPNAKAESMIGTPLYFAPEVCNNESYDERSDVWSLGVVFYEMCTLRRPFEADNLFTLIQLILESDIEPFNNGVDASLEGLVRLMLDRDPSRRPTAQELIDVHLEVPVSHPSHPSQKPAIGRALQHFSGPELHYNKKWPPPKGAVTAGAASKRSGGTHTTSEWIHTGAALDVFVELQRTTHGILNPAHASPGRGNTTAAAAATPRPATARNTVPKPGATCVRAKSVKTPTKAAVKAKRRTATPAATSAPTKRKPESTALLLSDGVQGSSLSGITMRDLHIDVQRRRSAMFGEDAWSSVEDAPLLIELQVGGSVGDSGCASRVSRGAADGSPTTTSMAAANSTSRKESISFLADVAAAIDRHTSNGRSIDLDVLDEAASLLGQYKLLNYGVR